LKTNKGCTTIRTMRIYNGTQIPQQSKNFFMLDKCSQCGLCCRLFLVNLAEEEYRSGKYRTQFEKFGLIDDFYRATACGANILKQKKTSNCIYLKANICSIYKIRPQVCREFFCTSKLKKFRKMIEQIEKKRSGLEKKKSEPPRDKARGFFRLSEAKPRTVPTQRRVWYWGKWSQPGPLSGIDKKA
jgi:Fe-S-cluster containining protein